MVDRLITSLRALAACDDRSPHGSRCEEIRLDFSDALMLVSDCQQVELTPVQRAALQDLDEHLQEMAGAVTAHAHADDVRTSEVAVRRLAVDALHALGYPATASPDTHSQNGRAR